MKKISKITLLLVVIFVFSLFTANTFAAPLADDKVLSQHIKEADGTSGQDTNSGSGIKTGHIQDGAVTDAKITGPISGSKLGAHSHSGNDITSGTVAEARIDTAIARDNEIMPTVLANDGDSSGLDADLLDGQHASAFASSTHNHDAMYQKKYAKVAVVAQSGGDYTDPVTAMNNLSTWCGTPSATNPCLLKIMPGVYNIGTNRLQMQQYVDIEGSGENTTKITGNIDGFGVVSGASNAEIRFLTIESKQTGGYFGLAISNTGASPKITNVTAIASGGNYTNYGIINGGNSAPIIMNATIIVSGAPYDAYGILNTGTSPSPIITNVTVNVSGGWNDRYVYGIYNVQEARATIRNVTVTASSPRGLSMGIRNEGNPITKIDQSVITGQYAVYNSTGATTYIGYTRLDNPVYNGGILKCIGVYDSNYDSITCP